MRAVWFKEDLESVRYCKNWKDCRREKIKMGNKRPTDKREKYYERNGFISSVIKRISEKGG